MRRSAWGWRSEQIAQTTAIPLLVNRKRHRLGFPDSSIPVQGTNGHVRWEMATGRTGVLWRVRNVSRQNLGRPEDRLIASWYRPSRLVGPVLLLSTHHQERYITWHCHRSRRYTRITAMSFLRHGLLPVREVNGVVRSRKKPKCLEQIKVWVRSGGHCSLCHRYLLESEINFEFVKLGELAHIVAQTNSALAPRGLSELPEEDRDLAENLMLACAHCHGDIDKREQVQRLDVNWLLGVKHLHESRIREATRLAIRDRTVPLRLVGNIRGATVEIGRREVVTAINAVADRAPAFALDPNLTGPEIDLRSLPGEANPIASGYYDTACARISEILRERLRPAVERGEIQHLSVFGLARIPLLVFFGSRLDDAVSSDIYQRHRTSESWQWDDGEGGLRFRYRPMREMYEDRPAEAVLVVNVSGTVDEHLIPIGLGGLPRFRIDPVEGTPHRDAIRSRASRDSFHDALSSLLGHLEAKHKQVGRLHVFAAVPVSAAIILGRSVGWGFHPDLVVYDHVDDRYELALEVSAP